MKMKKKILQCNEQNPGPLNYSPHGTTFHLSSSRHHRSAPSRPLTVCKQPPQHFSLTETVPASSQPQLFFASSPTFTASRTLYIDRAGRMVPSLQANESPVPKGCSEKRKRSPTVTVVPQQPKVNPSQTFVKSSKYLHIHCFVNTGKWGVWFNNPTLLKGKRRLYFGSYDTEYLAARAQDRAALKFKPDAVHSITHLNFKKADYQEDKDLRERLTHEQFRRLLMAESRSSYNKAEPSPCWRKFLTEEAAKGNLPSGVENQRNRFKKTKTLTQVLEDLKKVEETTSSNENSDDDEKSSEDEEEPVKRTKRRNSPLGGQLASPLPKRAARSVRSRPVPEPVPEPTPESKVAKVRPSAQSSVNLDRLVWAVTGKRSPRFAVPAEVTSDTSNENEERGSELTIQNTRSEPASESSGSVTQPPQVDRGNNVMIRSSTLGLHAPLLGLAEACSQLGEETT